MNLSTKQKQSYRCRKEAYGYPGGKGGEGLGLTYTQYSI